MITKQEDGSTCLSFGYGDTSILFGIKNGCAHLLCSSIPQREISIEIFAEKMFANPEDFPLSLTFSNIESLDTLIEALQDVRKLMIRKLQ